MFEVNLSESKFSCGTESSVKPLTTFHMGLQDQQIKMITSQIKLNHKLLPVQIKRKSNQGQPH